MTQRRWNGWGLDHRPYLEKEKQPLGMDLLRSILSSLDPKGIMNPGKLIGKGHDR